MRSFRLNAMLGLFALAWLGAVTPARAWWNDDWAFRKEITFNLAKTGADIAGSRFDTLSVMGLDEDGAYFSRGFENHGFYRNYKVSRGGDIWTFTGATERAKVAFEDNGKRQVWTWEWKPADAWLPLCDRTAERID